MKNKIKLMTFLLYLPAFASAAPTTGSHASYEEVKLPHEETMKSQVWGLSPQIGFFSYTDTSNNYTSRMAVGLGYDLNLAPSFWEKSNLFFTGIATGFLYSHVGSNDANLFGNNGINPSEQGANVLTIPIDLKVGYNVSDSFRLSFRSGGNLIYRSIAKSIDLGPGSNSSDELWKIYPNAGLDAEIQVNKNFSLAARPDMTFTPGRNIFIATVGATIMGY
jgi:hypothetical protein